MILKISVDLRQSKGDRTKIEWKMALLTPNSQHKDRLNIVLRHKKAVPFPRKSLKLPQHLTKLITQQLLTWVRTIRLTTNQTATLTRAFRSRAQATTWEASIIDSQSWPQVLCSNPCRHRRQPLIPASLETKGATPNLLHPQRIYWVRHSIRSIQTSWLKQRLKSNSTNKGWTQHQTSKGHLNCMMCNLKRILLMRLRRVLCIHSKFSHGTTSSWPVETQARRTSIKPTMAASSTVTLHKVWALR